MKIIAKILLWISIGYYILWDITYLIGILCYDVEWKFSLQLQWGIHFALFFISVYLLKKLKNKSNG